MRLPLGALIFQSQDATKSPFNYAVSRSCFNPSYEENLINHVGVVVGENIVAEAVPQVGVRQTPLSDFLSKALINKAAFIKESLSVEKLVKNVKSCLGQPYNATFYANGEGYYCSELITEVFNRAAKGVYFKLSPMNFKDKKSGLFIPFWVEYFRLLDCPIPQGRLGSHPFSLYRQKSRFKKIMSI